MDRPRLIEFLKAKLGQGPPDNEGDVAAKVHFYDIAAALLTDGQWHAFLKDDDDIALKRIDRQPFFKAIADSLSVISKEVCTGNDDVLTLIMYGIVTHSGRLLDLFAHLGPGERVSIGKLKTYKLKV